MATTGRVMLDMAMSLDGFTADRGGFSLYPIDRVRRTESLNDLIESAGAVVMGRRAYEVVRGDFTGYEYQVPIFVLTHHPPERPAQGLTFTFVTEGAREAVRTSYRSSRDS